MLRFFRAIIALATLACFYGSLAEALSYQAKLSFVSQGKRYELVRKAGSFLVTMEGDVAPDYFLLSGRDDGKIRLQRKKPVGNACHHLYEYEAERALTEKDWEFAANGLWDHPDVAYVTPFTYPFTEKDPYLAGNHLVMKVPPEVSEDSRRAFAEAEGLTEENPLWPELGLWRYRVQKQAARNIFAIAQRAVEVRLARWAHPDFFCIRKPRDLPNDPYFSRQWPLYNTGQTGGTPGADIGMVPAWDLLNAGYSYVSVGIIDTGMYVNPPPEDVAAAVGNGWDVTVPGGDDDPAPSNIFFDHGTSVAGVIACTKNNGIGIAGIAPGCTIHPIRLINHTFEIGNTEEVLAFQWALVHGVWIVNCSWGPEDGLGVPQPLPDVTAEALEACATAGRGGLGMLIFWASGNGGSTDTVDDDGYASNPFVIAVGAVSHKLKLCFYSEEGQSLDLCAPGGENLALITTLTLPGSLSDDLGGGFTSTFSGTSAAAPHAVGVAALLLAVEPGLTREQAVERLKRTARKDLPPYNFDRAGWSPSFGYGMVDAWNALANQTERPLPAFGAWGAAVLAVMAGGLLAGKRKKRP